MSQVIDDTSTQRKNLAELISKARKRLGLTQEQASQMCGFSTSYFSMVETERRIPKTDYMLRIIRSLDIPIDRVVDYVPEEIKELLEKEIANNELLTPEETDQETIDEEERRNRDAVLAKMQRLPILENVTISNLDIFGGLVTSSLRKPSSSLDYVYFPNVTDSLAFAVKEHKYDHDNPIPDCDLVIVSPKVELANGQYVLVVREDIHQIRKLYIDKHYYTLEHKNGRDIYLEAELRKYSKARYMQILYIAEARLDFTKNMQQSNRVSPHQQSKVISTDFGRPR